MLGQARNTQRLNPQTSPEESRLVDDITTMATRYGRYGYRRITALLRERGWQVNHKKVERIWRKEGLKVPQKQPKRKRLWLNDGSCIRLRPEHKDHVWSYDFVVSRTDDGRAFWPQHEGQRLLAALVSGGITAGISHAYLCFRAFGQY